MIRILQIGLSAFPGGIETCIVNYYRFINKSKFRFDFAVIQGDSLAYADELMELGSQIFILKNYKKFPIENALQLSNILNQNEYDIVHINTCSAANPIPVKISCSCKKNPIVIVHSHSSNLAPGKLRKIMNAANRGKLRSMPVEKWACSERAGDWLWGESFETVNVIPNAINISRFRRDPIARERLRKKCGFQTSDNVVGFVGRLYDQKNVLFLPEILEGLRRLSPNYKMVVVGDGDMKALLTDKFGRLGLSQYVHFTGVCKDASPWYSVMDAFVLPSISEGLPVVGVEAQACTLPCFVSDHITEELNITGAVKYLPIDQGAKIWADAIHMALLDNAELRYTFPKEYDITYAVRRLEERYLSLMNRQS